MSWRFRKYVWKTATDYIVTPSFCCKLVKFLRLVQQDNSQMPWRKHTKVSFSKLILCDYNLPSNKPKNVNNWLIGFAKLQFFHFFNLLWLFGHDKIGFAVNVLYNQLLLFKVFTISSESTWIFEPECLRRESKRVTFHNGLKSLLSPTSASNAEPRNFSLLTVVVYLGSPLGSRKTLFVLHVNNDVVIVSKAIASTNTYLFQLKTTSIFLIFHR